MIGFNFFHKNKSYRFYQTFLSDLLKVLQPNGNSRVGQLPLVVRINLQIILSSLLLDKLLKDSNRVISLKHFFKFSRLNKGQTYILT